MREHVADLVLVHGGDTKGLDRIAAAWAERRKVAQVAFGLDRRLGPRAGFRRNEQMLSLNPRYLVAFAGNGVLERLVISGQGKGRARRRPPRAARHQSQALGARGGDGMTRDSIRIPPSVPELRSGLSCAAASSGAAAAARIHAGRHWRRTSLARAARRAGIANSGRMRDVARDAHRR